MKNCSLEASCLCLLISGLLKSCLSSVTVTTETMIGIWPKMMLHYCLLVYQFQIGADRDYLRCYPYLLIIVTSQPKIITVRLKGTEFTNYKQVLSHHASIPKAVSSGRPRLQNCQWPLICLLQAWPLLTFPASSSIVHLRCFVLRINLLISCSFVFNFYSLKKSCSLSTLNACFLHVHRESLDSGF